MKRFPVPVRTIGVVAVIVGAAGCLQRIWLGALYDGAHARELNLAIWVPLFTAWLVLCALGWGLMALRARALVVALEAIAQGDFTIRLPLPREAALREVQEAFAHANVALDALTRKLSSVDQERRRLFADLAHELATPSSAILGLSDTLSRPDLVATEELRASLHVALENESLRLMRLVEDVRDLAVVEDPDMAIRKEPTNLIEVVNAVRDRAKRFSDRVVTVTASKSTITLNIDAVRIEQVLWNLISNAIRHASKASEITITVLETERHVVCSVENHGEPLGRQTLARLGQRFFRADASRAASTGGLGLGLSIARAIVERHHGTVEFLPKETGGLSVAVSLPKPKLESADSLGSGGSSGHSRADVAYASTHQRAEPGSEGHASGGA